MNAARAPGGPGKFALTGSIAGNQLSNTPLRYIAGFRDWRRRTNGC